LQQGYKAQHQTLAKTSGNAVKRTLQ